MVFEILSELLQPYKEIVGMLASVVTIGQFLSGTFICKDVYKKGNTDGISANPFIGGIVIGILMLMYAVMLDDTVMLNVNISAILLNVGYLSFYYIYAKSKTEIFKAMSVGIAVIGIFLTYAKIEDPVHIEYRFGLLVTTLMLLLIASPLIELNDVIKKQDASCIPFPMVFSGTIVSFLWLLYGIILMNHFMIFQNIVGFILCVIQLFLCLRYPGDKEKVKKM